jgi:hypothetical protein
VHSAGLPIIANEGEPRSDHDTRRLATARADFAVEAGSHPVQTTANIDPMRWFHWLIAAVQAALVVGLAAVIRLKLIPLGIPGEWEWLRTHVPPPLEGLAIASVVVLAYAGFAGLGLRALSTPKITRRREAGWLLGLAAVAIAVQILTPAGAPDEYDLTKWAYVNYMSPATGYYQVAKRQAVGDLWKFLADYPVWIQSQDTMHIGTHPPGLIIIQCLLLRTMEQNPAVASLLLSTMPASTSQGFRQLESMDRRLIPRADRASLYLTALLTLLACSGTVVPLYLLARTSLQPSAAWAAAALWPLAPAANLFQPGADTAYPLLSTTALALAAWSGRSIARGDRFPLGPLLAVLSGLVLALGMVFTLAFLAVGLIVALVILSSPGIRPLSKAGLILASGIGFLSLVALGWAMTAANPVIVWSWNLRKHAGFYLEYPRTYLAWLVINPIELAIAMGLPSAVWCAIGFFVPRSVPRVAWVALLVLAVMDLVGRNMGEVARLWMLFLPPLLIAAGAGLSRLGERPPELAITIGLLGLQTLALQSMIQVVYPV